MFCWTKLPLVLHLTHCIHVFTLPFFDQIVFTVVHFIVVHRWSCAVRLLRLCFVLLFVRRVFVCTESRSSSTTARKSSSSSAATFQSNSKLIINGNSQVD
ncbi:hypothetical protein ACOSQ4_028937 [Xanthoceras sorbifolium]